MQPTDYYLPCVGSKAANRNAPGANRTRKLLTCPLHGGSKAALGIEMPPARLACPPQEETRKLLTCPLLGVRRQ